MPTYIDTETTGLHGVAVTLQYAEDDGPVTIYNFWDHSIQETLDLLEWLCNQEIVGFNLAFDWFHLNKIYNIFNLWPNHEDKPRDIIEELASIEMIARDGRCLKPVKALDLMLHAKMGPYQSLSDRKPITIKRVPTAIAFQLCKELEKRIPLKEIYFANFKKKNRLKWQVQDITKDGEVDPFFKNVVLRFAPTVKLKALAVDALGLDVVHFKDIQPALFSKELGFAPYAESIGYPGHWGDAWPRIVQHTIDHWNHNSEARKYAANDVIYLQQLYKHFGSPELADTNSTLACLVGAVRWKGFSVNLDKIKTLKQEKKALAEKAPKDSRYVKRYIYPYLTEEEKLVCEGSTKKTVLEEIKTWKNEDGTPTEAAKRAQEVLDARKATKEIELYDKIIKAGRFHASFKVIGTLSDRMSGADKLNPQGINKAKEVRSCFTLASPGHVLCGGDFESFEIAIAIAKYNDPKLYEDLTTLRPCEACDQTGKHPKTGKVCGECKGTLKTTWKIHGLFAMKLFPGKTYREIIQSKGTDNDLYDKGKRAVFSQLYGGDENTIVEKIEGVTLEAAKYASHAFATDYVGVAKARQEVIDGFCSMRQPGGIGSKVIWHEPKDYIESMLGSRRYFTLENQICKALFDLANKPPKEWSNFKGRVVRRDRDQTTAGATRSALFAAAFNVQSKNMRAAANHVIQSTGAKTTKEVQAELWKLQPVGIHDWNVIPMNVHDEIMVSVKPELVDQLTKIVKDKVETFRPLIPLIQIDWKNNMKSWAEK